MSFFSIGAGQNRIFGLDLLRFLAIFFVLLGHSVILAPPEMKLFIRTFVLDGVGIFFVLSGFLIGQILLKQIIREQTTLKDLFHFWNRRWMRTLPAYLVILTFLLIYTQTLKPTRVPEDWYKYFLFLQNFNVIQPPFFQESWSLSIEEWFYLLVPSLFFTFLIFFKRNVKAILLFLIISVIVGLLCYRWYLYETLLPDEGLDFQTDILQQVIPRLDAIMIGVFAAFTSIYYADFWKKLNHWNWFIAMILLLFIWKYLNASDESLYYCVFAPTLKAFTVFFMLPFLSNWRLKRVSTISKFITFISVVSYSIYLINRTIVIEVLIKYGINNNLKSRHIVNELWGFEYLLFWFASIFLAFILYKSVEVPFLKLRERLFAHK